MKIQGDLHSHSAFAGGQEEEVSQKSSEKKKL